MLLSEYTKVKWNSANKKHYVNKGYKFTKMGDEFECRVEDLSKGSNFYVNVKCDCEGCKSPYLNPMKYQRYMNNITEDGKYYCNKCATNLFARENMRKTKLKYSKSFEQWCIDNLSKDEADEILSRWDYEKNIDKYGNTINPSDISYASDGFNKKGYCLNVQKEFMKVN